MKMKDKMEKIKWEFTNNLGNKFKGEYEGEVKEIIKDASSGVCIEPESSSELLTAVEKLHSDEDLRQQMGLNGRNLVSEKYNRQKLAARLETILVAQQ